MHIKLAPSILNADFGQLADQVRQAEEAGADWMHVDVMDGQFVPNITMGTLVVEAVRRATRLPLDVHLMIEEPRRFVREFVDAGASSMTVHVEAVRHLDATVAEVRGAGAQVGVALCPATPLAMVEEIATRLDLLLVMTVNPGFGGQRLISETVDKVARARAMLDRLGAPAELQVDGGVTRDNVGELVARGATVIVAGSSVFVGGEGISGNVAALRARMQAARP
ncbi:MAG: ribulose-phosphate 3-epimerase [Chloroflexi bacterium]|nr:ribulose-phosphate 3-epimerase [Chloroflexota bacterium]